MDDFYFPLETAEGSALRSKGNSKQSNYKDIRKTRSMVSQKCSEIFQKQGSRPY